MTLFSETGSFLSETSAIDGTTQKITFAGTAFTPKALWIWSCATSTGAGTYSENAFISYGFSDGTNDACITGGASDNAGTSATGGRVYNNAICCRLDARSTGDPANENRRASVQSFDSDGFTLLWDNSDGNALTYHYLAIGGTDITNVFVLNTTALTGSAAAQAYTGVGFQGDFCNILCGSAGQNVASANAADWGVSIGAATSSSARWFVGGTSEDAAPTMDAYNFKDIAKCAGQYITATGALETTAQFTSFDSNGVTLTWDTNGPGSINNRMAFLVIKGGLWDVGNGTAPATATTQNVSITAGRDPEAFMIFSCGDTVTSSGVLAEDHFRLGIGGCDQSLHERASSLHDTDAAATSISTMVDLNTKVLRTHTANATAGSSTTLAEADCTGMSTAGQFTLSWTTTLSGMVYMWFVVSPAPSGTQFNRSPSADTVTISDASLNRVLSAARVPSADTTTVTAGTATRQTQAFRSPTADTTTVTDSSLTRIKTAIAVPSADSTTVSDVSLTRMKSAVRNPSDTTVVGETLTRNTQAFRTVTPDTATISDVSTTRIKTVPRVPSTDSTTISDASLVRLLSAIRIPSTDTTTVVEQSLTRSRGLSRIPSSDTTTVVDASLTSVKTISRVPSADSTTVVDTSLTRLLALVRLPSTDTTVVTAGTATRLYSGLRVPTADTTALSENVTGEKSTAGVNYTRSPAAESTTVSDGTLNRFLSILRVPSAEIINIVESSLTRRLQLFRSPVSDSTVVTDVSLVRVLSRSRAPPEDTVPILDSSITRRLSALRTPSQDTSVISDNVTRLLQLFRSPTTDTTALSENVSRTLTTAGQYNRNVGDTVAIQESLQRLLSLKRIPSADTSAITENLVRVKTIPRAPGTDTINIIDALLVRSLTAVRSPTSESFAVDEASLVRRLTAFRSPTADTTTVSELVGVIGFARALQDTVTITEPLLQRIVTTVRQVTDSTDIAEDLFFETYKRLVFDSVIVADQLFSERQLLSGPTTYATPDEVRPLLGNLGSQRTDAQIALAVDAAYDEINTKTNRIPPNDWKDTEHNFGIVKKLARYIAAREMAIGIKDFDTKPLDMEIEHLFNDLLTYDTSSDATSDIVGSSQDETYALNEGGIIWSTRYRNLKKGSSGENDETINPNT